MGTCLSVTPDGTVYVGGYSSGGLANTGTATQFGYGGGSSDGFILVLSNDSGGQTPPPNGAAKGARRVEGPRGRRR